MGTLIADWIWSHWRKANPDANTSDVYMLNSAVSTSFSGTMAAAEGFGYEETLTGFKWMADRTVAHRALGHTVLLAWEESIGFMPGAALDKDGVVAGGMFAEMAAFHHAQGRTLQDQLHSIFNKYGYHVCRGSYFICKDPEVKAAIFARLRGPYPESVGGTPVRFVRDLTVGFDNSKPDNVPTLPVDAKSEMITLTLGSGSVVTVRGSGTEPKIKYYIELKTAPGLKPSDVPEIEKSVGTLERAVAEDLIQATKHRLIPKA